MSAEFQSIMFSWGRSKRRNSFAFLKQIFPLREHSDKTVRCNFWESLILLHIKLPNISRTHVIVRLYRSREKLSAKYTAWFFLAVWGCALAQISHGRPLSKCTCLYQSHGGSCWPWSISILYSESCIVYMAFFRDPYSITPRIPSLFTVSNPRHTKYIPLKAFHK